VDGRRVRGFVFDFLATREAFQIFPVDGAGTGFGTTVSLKELKALYFVKQFEGDPDYLENKISVDPKSVARQAKKIEVVFSDGERLLGTTEAYSPARLGFFMYPADPKSNNQRIFVINANVREVAWTR